MKKEMDFKIWVQEYEEEAKKITERIAGLKECLKSCSKSERENLQFRWTGGEFLQSLPGLSRKTIKGNFFNAVCQAGI